MQTNYRKIASINTRNNNYHYTARYFISSKYPFHSEFSMLLDLFFENGVFFGKHRKIRINCATFKNERGFNTNIVGNCHVSNIVR